MDWNDIQPVHPKGYQFWVFIGKTDFEAETAILWPPDVKSWLIWKDPDAGKDWGQEKKGITEGQTVWWHHWLNGYWSGWTLGVGDEHGGLACCGSWSGKESDTTERLNWTILMNMLSYFIDHYMSSDLKFLLKIFVHWKNLNCVFSFLLFI